jgi:diguanylate cyclase (GGDEF)-like protein
MIYTEAIDILSFDQRSRRIKAVGTKKITVMSLVATMSLFMVLLSLSVFSVWTALLNQQAISGVGTSTGAHHLAELLRVQNLIVTMIPLIFAVGVLLVGVSFYASRLSRRRIVEASLAEIALLEKMVSTDPLTGLGNHYAYQQSLANALENAGGESNMTVIALIDIDEFKTVNDEMGYQYGDEVLMALGSLLYDANISDSLFRLSGDDFAILVPNTSLAEATPALERLCEEIRRKPLDITVSIGIAGPVSGGLSRELLHTQATLALREAKRRGRNRVLPFEAIEGSVRVLSPEKTRAVRRLLSESKMRVAFQPIWNLSTGTLLAFEALARPAAEYGFAGPQEMFDIAEQMGRAHELDLVCIRAILARAAELPPGALLFMNLIPQTLVHDLLTGALLLEAVAEAGLNPSRVVLEITERSIVDLVEVVEKAKLLQLLGFQVALDDTGAGNAGLEMLSQLSVQFVKIDRAIVSNALTDRTARSVFAGITTIARESRTPVIAEGIETPEMLDFVRQVAGQYVQGYLLGRPSETIPEIGTLQDLGELILAGSH